MAIIGIDLGTTNSLAAVWRDGKSELIPNDINGLLEAEAVNELGESTRLLIQNGEMDEDEVQQRLHEAYVLACRLARDMSEEDAEVDQEYAAEGQPAWNFDQLIGNGQSMDAGRPESKEPDWDFDELLQGNDWGEFADLTVDIEEWREMRRLDKMLDKLRKAHPHRCWIMELIIWGRVGGPKAERAEALKLLSQFERYLEEGAGVLTWKTFLLSGEFRHARSGSRLGGNSRKCAVDIRHSP